MGKLVRLRAVEPSDHTLLAAWLNDPEVMLFWGNPGNTQSVPEVSRLEEAVAQRDNSRKYMIEPLAGDAATIGQIDYYDLNWKERSAWASIMIGDRQYWGGGYGTDAMRTLLRYLFDQLNLHRVALNVHAENTRAQKSYTKNGFVEEGRMRDWAYFDGKWHDALLMSVLAQDFSRL